jgi:choline-sulfatase
MSINRREFLKLSTLLTASTFMQQGFELIPKRLSTDPEAKNVLIILFDALSAININFYGYPRETMPNLTRLLERATVYHNHHASSNFTTPGTASLLTGRHVWEHLAIKLTDEVKPELTTKNIFHHFENYYKLANTHNIYADILLAQFGAALSQHDEPISFLLKYDLVKSSMWFSDLMKNDRDTAMLFMTRLVDTTLDGYLYSLLFPSLLGQVDYAPPPALAARFPRGLPEAHEGLFILEDAIDWIIEKTQSLPQPFLQFFHFLPPHDPYKTRKDFFNVFLDDAFMPPEKPPHPVMIPSNKVSRERELEVRRWYDEFLLYVDSEFTRLFTSLDQLGILENTVVVFTSDHGELFGRGTRGHSDSYLFDPLVKIPLIIFDPGQTQRKDIYTLTSCIDVLPTLLHYTGQSVPANLPGQILPPFSTTSSESPRTIYALDSRHNLDHSHITIATLMMRRDNMKVIRYSGYADSYRYYGHTEKLEAMQTDADPFFEVFNLDNDPEELNNLALTSSAEIQELVDELEQFYRENVEYPQV